MEPPRTRSGDPWPKRLGFLAMFAFGAPLLGAELGRYTGVHPRVLGYSATLVVVVVCVLGGYRKPARIDLAVLTHALLGLLAIAVLLAVPYDQALWVLDPTPTQANYPGFKVTRVLLIVVPTIILGAVVYPIARDKRFVRGLSIGSWVLAGVASGQLLIYRSLLASGSGSDWAAFRDDASFSTISVAMLFVFALISVQAWAVQRRSALAVGIALVVSAGCLFAAFMLAQRTTIGLGIVFSCTTLLRVLRARPVAALLWLGVAVGAAAVVLGFVTDGVGTGLEQYVTQFGRVTSLFSGEDASANYRVQMWGFAFKEAAVDPLGHGLGSFAGDFREQFYPHNVLAEAAYELGVLGFFAVAALCLVSVWVVIALARVGDGIFVYALVTGVLWVMKAGDITTLGNWIFWLYLGLGAYRGPQKSWSAQ